MGMYPITWLPLEFETVTTYIRNFRSDIFILQKIHVPSHKSICSEPLFFYKYSTLLKIIV